MHRSIMRAAWPAYDADLDFAEEERKFARIMEAIKAIRNTRTEMNVPPSRKAAVYVATEYETIFTDCAPFFERLASASGVFVAKEQTIEGAVQVATQSARIFLPMDDLIDKDKERERLNREKAKCEKEIEIHSKKLANENFVSKAPEKVVNDIRGKLAKSQELLEKIESSLAALGWHPDAVHI